MNFQSFVDDIQKNQWEVYGAEVYQDGQLIHRYGDTTDHRYPIYSATKTITAITFGMAADEGKLDINQSVLKYLPKKNIESLSSEQRQAYRNITLKRLFTMSVCGYPFRPEGTSWLDNALQYPLIHPEKPQFAYSNIPAYLAGVAVSCAVGRICTSI